MTSNDTQVTLAPPTVAATTVTQPVPALPNGSYVIAYRIVSEGGHPVSGTVTFGLAAPASPTSTTPATAAAAPAPSTPATAVAVSPAADDTGRGTGWVWVLSGIVVLGAAVLAIRRLSSGSR